jgi:hypothetical protein
MKNQFVKVNFDLHCDWKRTPPTYRVYINHELFTERSYVWGGTQYLTEMLHLNAPPGVYNIRVDNLGDADCVFKIRNLEVETGHAQILDSKSFEILNYEST